MPFWKRILKSRAVWLAGAALVIATVLFFAYVARYGPDPQETIVLGQAHLFADSTAAFRVLVRDCAKSTPIAGARVKMAIEGPEQREELGDFTTGADGSLSEPVHVPALAPGQYKLIVDSSSPRGRDHIVKPLRIERSCRLYVTTDKPVYQPGQTIHIRSLSLDEVSLRPVADQPILFEVLDARGNKVFKSGLATSPYGIASCDFALGSEVNLGDYDIRVSAGRVEVSKKVWVQRYVLPRFKVALTADKPFYLWAESVCGTVRADYFFGKPVAGAEVTVVGRTLEGRSEEIFRVMGTTDPNGTFHFETAQSERLWKDQPAQWEQFGPGRRRSTLPDNLPFQVEVIVKDGAGHEETALERYVLSRQAIDIHVFPEGGNLLRDVENALYIVTAYPTGRPAACEVEVNGAALHSDALGVTVLKTPVDAQSLPLNIEAQDPAGLTGAWRGEILAHRSGSDLQLRTDKAVYRSDEKPQVTIMSPSRQTAFFLDVLRHGQTVLTRTLSARADGQAQITLDLPGDMWGTLVLKAYVVRFGSRIDMETRVIYVRRPDELRIETVLDKATYRPGETARAQFQVADSRGAPAVAALSLAAVDEAVFYVQESQPGVLEQLVLTEGRLPLSGYEMAFAVSPAQLLSGDEPYQNLARALFSARGQTLGRSTEYRKHREDGNRELHPTHRDLSSDNYGLQVATRGQKLAETAAFRHRYLHVPLLALAVLAVLLVVLGFLAFLTRSLFRLFRHMAAEEHPEGPRLAPAADRRIYVLVFAVLLPLVTYLVAVVFACCLDSYRANYPFRVDPRLLGVLVVILSALATFGFPLVYRSSTVPWRQLNKGALGVLSLPVLCLALSCWITYAGAQVLMEVSRSQRWEIFGFLSLAVPVVLCLGTCWRAGIASRRPPGRFYAELGRSGQVVLVILLVQTLVLPPWVLASTDRFPSRIRWRSTNSYGRGLSVYSDAGAGPQFYGEDYGWTGGMGGMASSGGMGGYGAAGMAGDSGGPRREHVLPAPPRVRTFFPETLLWQPQVITDETGRASVDVPLADSITAWKLNVDAVAAGGQLGNSVVDVRTFQDFFVDLDVPVALTRGDEMAVPVLCHNYLSKPQVVALTLQSAPWYEVQGPATQQVELGPNDVKSAVFRIKAKEVGAQELAVLAQGASLSDAVRRKIEVRPDGVEVEDLQSGVLVQTAQHTFNVPPEAVPHSQRLLLRLYPSLFSEVIEGLDSILRMPYGCFEQTSSATYPNIMALLYMRHTGQVNPEIEAKARAHIEAGYQRLLTFEIRDGGFDWFGRPPAKEKVTAYGLLQLTDLAQVHEIDPGVTDRAKRWLLGRQNHDGSWADSDRRQTEPNQDARVDTTAYIAWALAQADVGDRQVEQALEFLRRNIHETDSAYTRALTAHALLTRDPNDAFGRKLLAGLLSSFRSDGRCGWVPSTGIGALYSRGSCLDVETTALTALAMMKVNDYADRVPKALAWLCDRKDRRGTWGSTQATILAMKALIAGTRVNPESEGPMRVRVVANDRDAGSIEVTPQTRDLLHSLDLTDYLRPGANIMRLTRDGAGDLPYRLVGTYWTPRTGPATAVRGDFEMAVDYDRDRLTVSDMLRCSVQVAYLGIVPAQMTVVELALPPGFAVDVAAFERLVESGAFARYEMASDRVVLYARSTAPKSRIQFTYELKAQRPLRVQVAPARVYEYYQPENRAETESCEIVVE